MEIVSENGKDYLVSYIAKLSNSEIDASGFFTDIKEAVAHILKNYNRKNNTKYTYIDKRSYGYGLQAMVNRFSGDYFSPSFMKNYMANPAMCLFSNLFTEQVNDATAIGTTFHKVMEEYYKQPAETRQRDQLFDLKQQYMPEGQNEEKLDEYIKGYYDIDDYLGGQLDDTKLKCQTERYGRTRIYIKKYDYTLPCDVSYIADRIDFREEGNYILDYKTGHPRPSAATFDGFLGSMLLYKWAVEQELGIDVNGAYLIAPGNKDKYIELDFSEENEKKMIDMIELFYRQFNRDTKNRTYQWTNQGYFNNADARALRTLMNDNTKWMCRVPVRLYIGETEQSPC